MPSSDELVWVCVDVARGGQVSGYRGLIDAGDLDAIVSGTFTLPFFLLEHVHWIESTWNEAERRHKIKVTLCGRDGTVRGHKGSLYLRPEHIVNIAPLHNCTELIRGDDRFRDEE